jgi:protein TonB
MHHWIKLIAMGVVIAIVCAAAAADRAPVKVSGSEQAGRIIRMVKPVYPPDAKDAGVQGVVRLRATISEEGKITGLETISGHQLLTPAALEAVRQWEYQPTLKNGKPVAVITDIDVNFTLSTKK